MVDSEVLMEKSIPARFDEYDPTDGSLCVLRTLVDFTVTGDDGRLLSFEELESSLNGKRVIVRGFVVEPLKMPLKQQLVDILSTAPHDAPKSVDEFAIVVPQKRNKRILANVSPNADVIDSDANSLSEQFDRTTLKVGDVVDGYCVKTLKWYEAKIVDASNNEKGDRLKLHFKGWNSKYDEWVDRDSTRIARAGESCNMMYEAAKRASDMVPWYQPIEIEARLRELGGEQIFQRDKVAVEISGIEDWCIDYTYANPSLWLVSITGVWYRVAGPLCPGGCRGSPSAQYSPFFAPVLKKYLCAAHVAMVLLDFLTTWPKLDFLTAVKEVQLRSKGEIDEVVILTNSDLLCNQIAELDPPADWNKKISISGCPFMAHLKKHGDIFLRSGGRMGLSTATHAAIAAMAAGSEANALQGSKKRKSVVCDAEKTGVVESDRSQQGTSKLKYPIEDTEHWQMECLKRGNPLPLPLPSQTSPQLLHPTLTAQMLQIWTTITNFRGLLSLPFVPYHFFEASLLGGRPEEGSLNSYSGLPRDAGGGILSSHPHPLIREIHVRMMTILVEEKFGPAGLIAMDIKVSSRDHDKFETNDIMGPSNYDEDEDTSRHCFVGPSLLTRPDGWVASEAMSLSLNIDGDKRKEDEDKDVGGTTSWGHKILSKGKSGERGDLDGFLRSGDAWVEVLRILLAQHCDLVLEEYSDPLAECLDIVEALMRIPEAAPFCAPVDSERDGVADYFLIIREPIDLGTIRDRLQSGWYDENGAVDGARVAAIESQRRDAIVTALLQQHRQSVASTELADPGKFIKSLTQVSSNIQLTNLEDHSDEKASMTRIGLAVGDLVDCFHTSTCCWYEAEIVDTRECGKYVLVRYLGFGKAHDELIESCSGRLAANRTRSQNSERRMLAPDVNDFTWESPLRKLSAAIPACSDNFPSFQSRNSFTQATNKSIENYKAVSATKNISVRGRAGGHQAVARDIRQIWKNCQIYIGRQGLDHPLIEIATQLSVAFECMYEKRINSLKFVNEPQHARLARANFPCKNLESWKEFVDVETNQTRKQLNHKGVESNESEFLTGKRKVDCAQKYSNREDIGIRWQNICSCLSMCGYMASPVVARIELLFWLCNKFVQSEASRAYLDAVVEHRLKIEKSVLTEKVKEKYVKAEIDRMDSNANKKRKVSDLKLENGDTDNEPSASVDNDIGGQGQLRLKPLGKDRHHRLFWAFEDDDSITNGNARRLFCECPTTGEWLVYSCDDDVNILWNWLCDKGVREAALKKQLGEWMQTVGIAMTAIPKGMKCIDELSSTHTENPQTGKIRTRKASISWDTFDFSESWSVYEKKSLALLVSVKLEVGHHQLGVGLKMIEGRVVISGFRTDDKSAGKEAGLRVGDIIIALEGRLVTDVTTIQDVLKGLQSVSRNSSGLHSGAQCDGGKRVDRLKVTAANPIESEQCQFFNLQFLILRNNGDGSEMVRNDESQNEEEDRMRTNTETRNRCEEKSNNVSNDRSGLVIKAPITFVKPLNTFRPPKGKNRGNEKALLPQKRLIREERMRVVSHPLREQTGLPSRLMGSLLELLLLSGHPFAAKEEWNHARNGWILNVCAAMTQVARDANEVELASDELDFTNQVSQMWVAAAHAGSPLPLCPWKSKPSLMTAMANAELLHAKCCANLASSQRALLIATVNCLLELESALRVGGNILARTWTQERRCFKWRIACSRALTFAQLSVSLAVFDKAIFWSRLDSAASFLARKVWLEDAPKCYQHTLPAEGSQVLYFGDGHAAAVEADRGAEYPLMWGASSSPFIGTVLPCIVTAVRVLLCGPPEQCQPFAQIDLVVSKAKHRWPTLLSVDSDEDGRVFRVVNRIVNIVGSSLDAAPFLEPVSRKDHPDYDQVVLQPIDLATVKIRARIGYYTKPYMLLDDIQLLRNNCALYCTEKYPGLVCAADRLLSEAQSLLSVFRSELDSGRQYGTVAQVSEYSGVDQTAIEKAAIGGEKCVRVDICAAMPSGETKWNSEFQSPPQSLARGRGHPRKAATAASDAIAETFASSSHSPFATVKQGSALKGIPLAKGTIPGVGEGFTICMRLLAPPFGKGQAFLVEPGSLSVLPKTIKMDAKVRFRWAADMPSEVSRYGTVVGCKSIDSDTYSPCWEWLEVEWADGHCEPNFVNSWDVEVVENVHVFDDKCDEEAIDISTRIENGGSRKSTRK